MILPIERPSESGRAQIFRIHSRRMKDLGYLADDVDMLTLAKHTAFYSGAEVEGGDQQGLEQCEGERGPKLPGARRPLGGPCPRRT